MIRNLTIFLFITLPLLSCGEDEEIAALAATRNAMVFMTYVGARDRGDKAAVNESYADSSYIWFGEKEGEGNLRRPDVGDPWAEWDKYFNSKSRYDSAKADHDSLWAVAYEINDFYRLVESGERKSKRTYYFNKDGKIVGELIVSQEEPDSPLGKLPEAIEWFRAKYPEELKQLQPEGEILPSEENAILWKKLLNEWRAEIGLEII